MASHVSVSEELEESDSEDPYVPSSGEGEESDGDDSGEAREVREEGGALNRRRNSGRKYMSTTGSVVCAEVTYL